LHKANFEQNMILPEWLTIPFHEEEKAEKKVLFRCWKIKVIFFTVVSLFLS